MADNEGKVCDAIVRMLEARTGHQRSNLQYPEKAHATGPVDLVFTLGAQQHALEHTKIEAFAGQINYDNIFTEFIGPVKEALKAAMPKPGQYHLILPIDAKVNAKPGDLGQYQQILVDWVRGKADEFHAAEPTRPDRDHRPHTIHQWTREQPAGFPYPVHLARDMHWSDSDDHDGIIFFSRFAPENIEDKRLPRIETAFAKKHRKLAHWKDKGAITHLVLESDDISLTNHALVGECIATLLPECPPWLDALYFIYTSLDRWSFCVWDWTDVWWVRGFHDSISAELDDLTA